MGVAVWQSASLCGHFSIGKHFFGAVCLGPKSEGSAQVRCVDCLLAEDLSCDQRSPVCSGKLQDDTIVSCEDELQVGVSILPLICWQGRGDGHQRRSCWDPKATSCHSRQS